MSRFVDYVANKGHSYAASVEIDMIDEAETRPEGGHERLDRHVRHEVDIINIFLTTGISAIIQHDKPSEVVIGLERISSD